jgi:hypothetical protein
MAILDASTANFAALASGQTLAQTDLDDLAAKIGVFKNLLIKPRKTKTTTEGATDLMPDKFAAAARATDEMKTKNSLQKPGVKFRLF